ncbi:glycosyltransferase family protein 2 [Abeliophyllum distichum]|uniref:Glycosyltransferase family protein 2 n=1 Tax=Abeliophyllum distichum TaxID=126358 RepID=A0ABD1TDX2_9LAMI
MAPSKKNILPLVLLFLLLPLSTIFLFSLSPSNPKSQILPQFPTISTLNPGPNFTLLIKVLTFNRLSSLSRCLNSLSKAQYDDINKVHLHVFIDHFLQDFQNGSADLDNRLNLSKKILDFVDGFDWKYGEKFVHYRTSNAGLQAQWLESWWPSSDHEFAFVVEDDLEVSPLYYRFLKAVILNYYYNASNFSPMIYGASLQRPRFVPGKHGNKMHLDSGTHLFLYQLVGTWGQLLFPKPWKEFRLWYDTHKAKGMKPYLEGMVTNGWYKKMGERIWTPWFIKFIHSHGEVLTNRIVRSPDELRSVLQSVQKNDTVIVISLYRVSETIVRNFLCHIERLNIRNYIFIGPTSRFLLDLARRGHPVIDADQFYDISKLAKSFKFQNSVMELIKEILVEAFVTKKCLELGYSTWLVDGNMIPLASDLFLNSFEQTNDFVVGKSYRILYVRSSSAVLKIWVDDFIHEAATLVNTLRKDSVSSDSGLFYAVEKILRQKSIKYNSMDERRLGFDINIADANQTSPGNEKKFAFWSSETELDIIQRQLVQLRLWVVDDESSCTAVVCHPS